ncbi:MAG: CHASE2 domain-containing protein, partial [Alphaproteobacteria bacterium]
MRRFLIRSMHILLPLTLLATAATLRIYEPRWLAEFQVIWFDILNVENPRPYNPESGVRIVDIDDESLERLGQWPWPRTRLAELIYRLREAGAAVVVFDIVFSEPDRTSPRNIVENWTHAPEYASLRDQAIGLPDHDEMFAAYISELKGIVTGFALTAGKAPRIPVQRGNFAFSGDDPTQFLPALPGAVANLAAFEKAAAGNGNFNVLPETDGLIRRVPLVAGFQLDEKAGGGIRLYPMISVEALRVAQGAKTMIIKSSGGSGETGFGEKTGVVSLKIGRIEVPTDNQGRVWVHYAGSQAARYVPIWKILDDSFDRSLIENHIVLVGASAAGLLDLRSTPLDQVLPGVEVHAELIEQILEGDFLNRPDWAMGAELAYLTGLGLILILLLPRLGAVWCAIIGGVAVVAVFGGSWYGYTEKQILLDPVYPSVAVLGIYLSASLISYIRTEGERKQVRGAFAQYLSPALVEQL